jgi:hypothetical protein
MVAAPLANACTMPNIRLDVHSSGDYRTRYFLSLPDFEKHYPDTVKGDDHKFKDYCGKFIIGQGSAK